jgi:hypothetical protein
MHVGAPHSRQLDRSVSFKTSRAVNFGVFMTLRLYTSRPIIILAIVTSLPALPFLFLMSTS